jgi:hypothetical protein
MLLTHGSRTRTPAATITPRNEQQGDWNTHDHHDRPPPTVLDEGEKNVAQAASVREPRG